jgi:putative redox protein
MEQRASETAMNAIHCTTERVGGARHRIEVRAHEFFTDLSVPEGGEDTAPNAHDYFDASLVACRALTAVWFARRNGIPLERVVAEVERDDSEERNGRYRLLVGIAFEGPLSEDQRRRLGAAVARCPITKLMTTTDVVIEEMPSSPR